MQPYFFPYLGYFDLINQSELFIVFDTVQYIYQGWMNRNRILHPNKSWWYFIVPIKKHPHDTSILDIEISQNLDWRNRILGQIQHYKKKAPFYNATREILEQCFKTDEISLSKFNVESLKIICSYLDISFSYQFFSEMNMELDPVESPGEWALNISKKLNASEYVNLPGGINIFDTSRFNKNNIKLNLRKIPPFSYTPDGFEYIPDLSIIDLLMWNPPEKIKEFLEKKNH